MSDAVVLRPERLVPRTLGGLVAGVPGLDLHAGSPESTVTGVSHDSRLVRPGELYAALPGEHTHGARFAHQAEAAGAAAVLTDAPGRDLVADMSLPVVIADDARLRLGPAAAYIYGAPSHDLVLLAVTGTNGKTTTTYLLEAGLAAAGHRTGLLGTIETKVADLVVPSQRTTPEASELQGLLAAMVERGVTAAAMEVSSHALALHRVDATQFVVAVFTNLTQDHLDFHADIEDYFNAKARLFTPEFCHAAVVDVDDDYGQRLATMAGVPVTRVATRGRADADWSVRDVHSDVDGSTFVLDAGDHGAVPVTVAIPGEFNVRNAALAIAALVTAGVDISVAVRGVASCTGVPGRMQRVDAGRPFLSLVDYAHTPDAVSTVLATVRPLVPGRVIVVLGCGGDRDHAKRPLMGAAAASYADIVVITSDNPRSEDPAVIAEEMLAGIPEPDVDGRIHVELDRRAAIRRAVGLAQAGDAVVVAGKGHERTQETAGAFTPFDDVGELRAALAMTTA